MDKKLLAHLGNMKQVAGIRESVLTGGHSNGMRVAEFHNAAGLQFTVCPDRAMDVIDFSYKGINFSFQSKKGMVNAANTSSVTKEFAEQWPAGMIVTCGLENVGGGSMDCMGQVTYTHGKISSMAAEHFGTSEYWDGDDYVLSAKGEVHQARIFGRHLVFSREVSTTLNSKEIHIHDTVTNMQPVDEPIMLLYHTNFGYPLLSGDCEVYTSDADSKPLAEKAVDPVHMLDPDPDYVEECWFNEAKTDIGWGVIWNKKLKIGGYIKFKTDTLPYFQEWKNMKATDYVLGIEPTNCHGKGRQKETEEGIIPMIPGYSTLEYDLKIGAIDGEEELAAFLGNR